MCELPPQIPFVETQELKSHKGSILTVQFNSDGGYCLSAGQDRVVRLYNPHRGTLVQEYSGAHGYEIADVAVASDNSRFSSCGGDKVSSSRLSRVLC